MVEQAPQVSIPAASSQTAPAAQPVAPEAGAQQFSAITAYHNEAKDGDGVEEALARAAAGRPRDRLAEGQSAEAYATAVLKESTQTGATQAVDRKGDLERVPAGREQWDVSAGPDKKESAKELLLARTHDSRAADGAVARERQPPRRTSGKKSTPYVQISRENESHVQWILRFLFLQEGWVSLGTLRKVTAELIVLRIY